MPCRHVFGRSPAVALESACLTGALIEIADLLGIDVPQMSAIDAAVRLKTILRHRAGPGATAGPPARAAMPGP